MNGRRPVSRAVSAALTRRELIAGAGAVAAATALPLGVLASAAPAPRQRLEDWTIDDMWGVYPRYAEPIGYGRRRDEPLVAANDVDAAFVVA